MIKGNEPDIGNTDLKYKQQELTNSYVLHCFELQRVVHIFSTRGPIEMEFESKCSILNG